MQMSPQSRVGIWAPNPLGAKEMDGLLVSPGKAYTTSDWPFVYWITVLAKKSGLKSKNPYITALMAQFGGYIISTFCSGMS